MFLLLVLILLLTIDKRCDEVSRRENAREAEREENNTHTVGCGALPDGEQLS